MARHDDSSSSGNNDQADEFGRQKHRAFNDDSRRDDDRRRRRDYDDKERHDDRPQDRKQVDDNDRRRRDDGREYSYNPRRDDRGDDKRRRDDRDDRRRPNQYNDKPGRREEEQDHQDDRRRENMIQRRPVDSSKQPHRVSALQPGMVVQGTVGRIEPYGAFVDLPCGQRGLVHISQLAPHRVDKTEDIVQDGMTVYCLVMDSDEKRKLRLSMRAVNQQTGELVDHDAGGTPRGVSGKLLERARQRRHAWDREATPSWRQAKDSQTHRIWARSPTPPPVAAAAAAAEKKKRQRTEESSSEGSSSSDESSSSSSSEDSYEERRRRHRQDKKRRRRRRRRSPSTSSSSESSSSSSSEDSETDKDVEEPKKPAPLKQSTSIPLEVNDQPTIEELNEAQDFQKAFQGAHNHDSEDEDEEGPMPLMVHKDGTGGASASKAYGKALLPGEGQAIASYVQQNLRVPRRGEIGYNQTDIEKYEQSGYVMSGSRHARMNAVRIRKENQIYSAEEQRALALIQVEENQQKEAQLMQEFRTMLEARRNQKTSNNQTAK